MTPIKRIETPNESEDDEEDVHDSIDYGMSEDEGVRENKDLELNTTKVLIKKFRNTKFGKTRCKHNIRYATNRNIVKVRFDSDDTPIVFAKRIRNQKDLGKIQEQKKVAEKVVNASLKDMASAVLDRIKQRKLTKLKKGFASASKKRNDTVHSAKDTVNVILDEIGGAMDDEEFDYIQVDQLNSSNQEMFNMLDPRLSVPGSAETG